MKQTIMAAVLALAPVPVLADCPVAGDLERGIWVTLGDESASHFKATANGLSTETIHGGGTPFVLEVQDGLHILREFDLKDGAPDPDTIKVYSYTLPGGGFPPPVENTRHEIPVSVAPTQADLAKDPNAQPSQEIYKLEYGAQFTLQIARCSYDSQIVTILYDTPGADGWTSRLNLLPDLGIAIVSATGEKGRFYDTFYQAVAISTTRPELPE